MRILFLKDMIKYILFVFYLGSFGPSLFWADLHAHFWFLLFIPFLFSGIRYIHNNIFPFCSLTPLFVFTAASILLGFLCSSICVLCVLDFQLRVTSPFHLPFCFRRINTYFVMVSELFKKSSDACSVFPFLPLSFLIFLYLRFFLVLFQQNGRRTNNKIGYDGNFYE